MKHRRVFSTQDIEQAQRAIRAARDAGVLDEDISLVARSDIEMESVPDKRHDVSMDRGPAALRGAIGGGGIGVIAGLIAMAVPTLGITIAGAALIAGVGAMMGSWSAALVGSTVPTEVRRRFEEEIEVGRILVVVDVEEEGIESIEAAIVRSGAIQLPYDSVSAIS